MTAATAVTTQGGDILLEAGTNELEVLVFRLAGGWFGVNVAKVREVIRPVRTVAAPHQHPSVMGMFNIRGTVLPIVDLAKHLSMTVAAKSPGKAAAEGGGEAAEGRVIIMEFNGLRTGFLVEGVEQIHRISWGRVKPAPDLNTSARASGGATISSTTGLIEFGERLVQMVDFESVADSILMHEKLHIERIENPRKVDRESKRVILVEDSPFMRNLMGKVFRSSGYARVEIYPDGQAAWDAIGTPAGGKGLDAVVSDIEMPRMDGLHLTKRIKESAHLSGVPVVLFSSLISQDNVKKGRSVGATVQIPKPELAKMVDLVDRVVCGETLSEEETGVHGFRPEGAAVRAA